MNTADWFVDRLRDSAAHFVWSAGQIPVARLWERPPRGLGDWPAARQVYHLYNYDNHGALPAIRQWLGEPPHSAEQLAVWNNEDADWDRVRDFERLIADFQQTREAHIALLPKFAESQWDETRDTAFGVVTLRWLVTKTWQHTFEHTNSLMRMLLFWDRVAAGQG